MSVTGECNLPQCFQRGSISRSQSPGKYGSQQGEWEKQRGQFRVSVDSVSPCRCLSVLGVLQYQQINQSCRTEGYICFNLRIVMLQQQLQKMKVCNCLNQGKARTGNLCVIFLLLNIMHAAKVNGKRSDSFPCSDLPLVNPLLHT